MKKIILSLSATALLGACANSPTNWSSDCASHYSTTNREKSNCLNKVEANKKIDIKAGAVSIDSGNTSRETFDDIGKGGAYDSNSSGNSGSGSTPLEF